MLLQEIVNDDANKLSTQLRAHVTFALCLSLLLNFPNMHEQQTVIAPGIRAAR